MGVRKFLINTLGFVGEDQPEDAFSVKNPNDVFITTTSPYRYYTTSTYAISNNTMEENMTANYLKSMNVRVAQMEDLILAKKVLGQMDATYTEVGMETPSWVMDRKIESDNEIIHRRRAELTERLKVARAKREDLATPEEKREKLDKEIADLEKALKV